MGGMDERNYKSAMDAVMKDYEEKAKWASKMDARTAELGEDDASEDYDISVPSFESEDDSLSYVYLLTLCKRHQDERGEVAKVSGVFDTKERALRCARNNIKRIKGRWSSTGKCDRPGVKDYTATLYTTPEASYTKKRTTTAKRRSSSWPKFSWTRLTASTTRLRRLMAMLPPTNGGSIMPKNTRWPQKK